MNFQGTDYAVSDQVFEQFKAGYEQAQKQSADKGNQQSLATLGIDPRRWLTDAKNDGEAKVGDTDTIKITGGVDVNKLLDDVNTALDKARSLGVQGSDQLPEKLTDEQKQQAAEAIKDLSRRDLHRQGGHDAAADARQHGRRGARERPERRPARSRSTSRCSTSTRTRRSRRPPARSRSTSCSASSAASGSAARAARGSGSGSGGSARAPAARPPRTSRSTRTASTEAGSDTAKAQKCAELLSP